MEKKLEFPVLVLLLFSAMDNAAAHCPMNLDYVTRMSWNTSTCRSVQTAEEIKFCTTTLRSVLGMGLAQFLRDQSMFELPDNASAIACLNTFQQKLSSIGLPSNVVQLCFNVSEFVSSPNLCGGIQTKKDWDEKIGPTSLDEACNGDLSRRSACTACFNSAQLVLQRVTDRIENITAETSLTCYYFVILYAIGVTNEFGPMSRKTATCALRVPFLHEKRIPRSQIAFYWCMGVAMIVILLCSLALGYYCWARMMRKAKHAHFVRTNRNLLKRTVKPNTGAVWFDIQEIKAATGNFSAANVIGQGGFGTVYKGTLSDGCQIAVKRITSSSFDDDAAFINEVEIINSIRHRNLVVLRGFCVASDNKDGRQRFLVYDYMANGSLDKHIFEGANEIKTALDWEQRKKIIIGTAKGLCYLHFGLQPAVYHRDIKATNILLDDEMNPCIADFGLATITSKVDSHLVTRIAGTHGYLAPEYALYGKLTDRSDVYSFGLVLLEIMSGRQALDTSVACASDYLITDWAWKLVRSKRTIEVVDSRIRESAVVSTME
ncbi:hypothetical protein KI387_035954, partial [Taxus chinensis]